MGRRNPSPTSVVAGRWGPETPPVLHELNLDMKRGHLIAVIGAVGSGKSTLMQAILGELYPVEDGTTHIARPEVIAYCSQIPHIAEGTLRENVIFGQKVDEDWRQWDCLEELNL